MSPRLLNNLVMSPGLKRDESGDLAKKVSLSVSLSPFPLSLSSLSFLSPSLSFSLCAHDMSYALEEN